LFYSVCMTEKSPHFTTCIAEMKKEIEDQPGLFVSRFAEDWKARFMSAGDQLLFNNGEADELLAFVRDSVQRILAEKESDGSSSEDQTDS